MAAANQPTSNSSTTTPNGKKTRSRGTATAAASVAVVPSPPTTQAPAPPAGFDPTAPIGRGASPWATLTGLAPQVAAEILGASTFAADFGAKLVPKDIAAALTLASAWRSQRTAAEAWAKYVKSEDGQAWRAAMRQLVRLKKAFDALVAADPAATNRYPQLAETFRARSASGTRGAKTKADKKAEQAAAAQALADAKAAAAATKPAG